MNTQQQTFIIRWIDRKADAEVFLKAGSSTASTEDKTEAEVYSVKSFAELAVNVLNMHGIKHARVIRNSEDTELMICADCFTAEAGDTSSFDYWYNPGESEQRLAEVQSALDALPGLRHLGDSEEAEEFSTRSCDCCGSDLAGQRYPLTTVELL